MFCLDIETSGLDPEKHFITCIGISSEHGIHQFSSSAKSFREEPLVAEKRLIAEFFEWIVKKYSEPVTVLCYNGLSFDYPFIFKRAHLHSLKVPRLFATSKVIDVMVFARKLAGRLISKDETIRKYSNIYIPRNSSGAYVARIYFYGRVTDDEHIEMLQHNSLDVCATIRFMNALKDYPDFMEFVGESLNATHTW